MSEWSDDARKRIEGVRGAPVRVEGDCIVQGHEDGPFVILAVYDDDLSHMGLEHLVELAEAGRKALERNADGS